MRLLPRSAKGTWLLAAAAWAGLFAVAWMLTPPHRRAVFTLPDKCHIVGFTSKGRVVTFTPGGRALISLGDLQVWDPSSGTARTVAPKTEFALWYAKSADCRWIVGGTNCDLEGNAHGAQVVDLETGREDLLSGPDDALTFFDPGTVSQNGDWLAVPQRNKAGEYYLQLWNLIEHRPGCRIRIYSQDTTFSHDGQKFAIKTRGKIRGATGNDEFVVFETATGHELSRFNAQSGYHAVSITADGAGLIATTQGYIPDRFRVPFDAACWDTSDGHLRWEMRDLDGFLAERNGDLCVAVYPIGNDDKWETRVVTSLDARTVSSLKLGREHDLKTVSPVGGIMNDSSTEIGLAGQIRQWFRERGVSLFGRTESYRNNLIDLATGARLLSLYPGDVRFFPDGNAILYQPATSPEAEIWDIPPRKSLTWFGIAAAVLALPIAWFGSRRSRRLRSLNISTN